MIAQRFRSIGWVAGCAAAALCCYLASQSVASERAGLARIDREIAATTGEIHRLNTEIAARGRMGQIERWNREVLALQAPAPGQFVANEVQLASLAGGKPLQLDPAIVASKGAVQTVAYQAPQPAAPTPSVQTPATAPQPLLRTATFVRPKAAAMDAPATGIVKASFVRTKSFTLDLDAPADTPKPEPVVTRSKPEPVVAAKPKAKPAAATIEKPVVVAKAKPAKTQALTASLLPSDLGKLIAAEKKGAKPARTATDR
ncbi:hypothetical protein Q4F19_03775 [Sphingomonas sp. BIUV-7]|uniref:Uncharacterized protein n=1 Tax=Sphingomonas natans TaxID=3063330 RepID=A0ABT8Y595_9SPHN|nr:hypothetical protein [Sphingomonas sp. BIUV-7]MDO6413494.1 hypothetical protein [Sphingomonas sp. BIUV-7]